MPKSEESQPAGDESASRPVDAPINDPQSSGGAESTAGEKPVRDLGSLAIGGTIGGIVAAKALKGAVGGGAKSLGPLAAGYLAKRLRDSQSGQAADETPQPPPAQVVASQPQAPAEPNPPLPPVQPAAPVAPVIPTVPQEVATPAPATQTSAPVAEKESPPRAAPVEPAVEKPRTGGLAPTEQQSPLRETAPVERKNPNKPPEDVAAEALEAENELEEALVMLSGDGGAPKSSPDPSPKRSEVTADSNKDKKELAGGGLLEEKPAPPQKKQPAPTAPEISQTPTTSKPAAAAPAELTRPAVKKEKKTAGAARSPFMRDHKPKATPPAASPAAAPVAEQPSTKSPFNIAGPSTAPAKRVAPAASPTPMPAEPASASAKPAPVSGLPGLSAPTDLPPVREATDAAPAPAPNEPAQFVAQPAPKEGESEPSRQLSEVPLAASPASAARSRKQPDAPADPFSKSEETAKVPPKETEAQSRPALTKAEEAAKKKAEKIAKKRQAKEQKKKKAEPKSKSEKPPKARKEKGKAEKAPKQKVAKSQAEPKAGGKGKRLALVGIPVLALLGAAGGYAYLNQDKLGLDGSTPAVVAGEPSKGVTPPDSPIEKNPVATEKIFSVPTGAFSDDPDRGEVATGAGGGVKEPPPARKFTEEEIENISKDPRETLDAFLLSGTVDDLLNFVMDRDLVEADIRAYYPRGRRTPVATQEVKFDSTGLIEGTQLSAYMYWVTSSRRQIPVSVEQTDRGYKVDWSAFTQFHDGAFEKFLRNPESPPGGFYVQLRRGHVFGNDIPDVDDLHAYRVQAPIAPFTDAYAFLRKSNPRAKAITERYRWSTGYRPFVKLKWVTPKVGKPRIELEDVVRPTWRRGKKKE